MAIVKLTLEGSDLSKAVVVKKCRFELAGNSGRPLLTGLIRSWKGFGARLGRQVGGRVSKGYSEEAGLQVRSLEIHLIQVDYENVHAQP